MRFKLLLTIQLLLFSITLTAEEGMWIPSLLKGYTIEQMQKKGFKLNAEDIYSVNKACLKDAVVIFGNGCTAELISDKGLIITNHHCGFEQIQKHSTQSRNYLKDGFWAQNQQEELINPDLTVTFLIKMEDVTDSVLAGIPDSLNYQQKQIEIEDNIERIEANAIKNTHYKAKVKPFFHGNQYFLFINEVFKDVRLVGAPPSAIGKFGGNTDNWMWPRHNADFALFRIYADKNNRPAEYSENNIPYFPKKHLSISAKGIKEGDFTMLMGYPGSTNQYAPSHHIHMLLDQIYPELTNIRKEKLSIIDSYQRKDEEIQIKYAVKYAKISNTYKRWIGEQKGLKKQKAIEAKIKYEQEIKNWINDSLDEHHPYKDIFPKYDSLYNNYAHYFLALKYMYELLFYNGMELVEYSGSFKPLLNNYLSDPIKHSQKLIEAKKSISSFYKNYHQPLDKELTIKLLSIYKNKLPEELWPKTYHTIDKKFKGNIDHFVNTIYKKSAFTDSLKLSSLLKNFNKKSYLKLEKDPVLILYQDFYFVYGSKIYYQHKDLEDKISSLNQQYMQAIKVYQSNKIFYPDANSTLRVTYGNVKGYEGDDAIFYDYQTTLSGMIEKDNPEKSDFKVPAKLKQLFTFKDYGQYNNSTLPLCFIASNHTTGGNSGSPVLNADGHLIGINFDRAWEGVMSDLMYNPKQCRNISLDIRFVLFFIEKYANADYLLKEMTILK